MKKSLLIAMALVPGVLFAQETTKKDVNLTIYNQNFGVVKEVRSANLTKGEMELKLTDVPTQIIPSSVKADFPGTIYEQNYRYDLVDMNKILEKYIDNKVTLKSKDATVSGILLSANGGQVVIRTDNGGLQMIPNINDYQISVDKLPEGFITKPTLVWNINANKSGEQDVNVTYQTNGLSWTAQYVGVLNNDDSRLDLKAWVSIDNHSGAAYKNAGLKLMAGEVRRETEINVRTGGFSAEYAEASDGMVRSLKAAPKFDEKALFEYHIYELNNRVTLADNETKQISLFEAKDVPVKKKYTFDFPNYSYNSYGKGKKPINAKVAIEFENTKENNLGMPFPQGIVGMNKAEGKGMEFIGEDRIDHTPKDETITLNIGNAFDILADYTTEDKRNISDKVFDETNVIELKNRKDKGDVVIEVNYTLSGKSWEILSASEKYEKKDANTIVFKVPVAAGKTNKLKVKSRITEW